MKLSFFLCLFIAAVPSFGTTRDLQEEPYWPGPANLFPEPGAERDFHVPEILPSEAHYPVIMPILEKARAAPDENMYQDFPFRSLKTENNVFMGARGLYCQTFLVNGHLFMLRLNYAYPVNYTAFQIKRGRSPGIYFIQRGYRYNINMQLERVVTTVKVATLNGEVLTSLPYHEELEDSGTAHPPN